MSNESDSIRWSIMATLLSRSRMGRLSGVIFNRREDVEFEFFRATTVLYFSSYQPLPASPTSFEDARSMSRVL